jgi:hypothetical protein
MSLDEINNRVFQFKHGSYSFISGMNGYEVVISMPVVSRMAALAEKITEVELAKRTRELLKESFFTEEVKEYEKTISQLQKQIYYLEKFKAHYELAYQLQNGKWLEEK